MMSKEQELTEEAADEQLKEMLSEEGDQAGTEVPGEEEGGDLAAPQVDYVEAYDPDNPTEIQEKAIEMGWNPEGVEGKPSIGSGEFVRNKSFFDEIHKLKKEIRSQQAGVQKLIRANASAKAKGREEALAELRQQRRLAAENGDTVKMLDISEEIERKQAEAVPEDELVDYDAIRDRLVKAGQGYIKANESWYTVNDVMKTYADSLHDKLYEQHAAEIADGVYEPEELFLEIDEQMKARFPEEMGVKPNKSTTEKPKRKPMTRTNEGGGKQGSAPGKRYTLDMLPADQRDVARQVIRDFKMKEDEYVKSFLGE
jgi:hypothetical protein